MGNETLKSAKIEKLIALLKELFQLDQPDLDFGIYRIMHAKNDQVISFLENALLPQVQKILTEFTPRQKTLILSELNKTIENLQKAGVDPENFPKVLELRKKLDETFDPGQLEGEIFDHLYTFFRRYYSEGDFLSKQVYKEGVYAIPYQGEEVKLHWANSDQYYIKTDEYLRDYTFCLKPKDQKDPLRVHFCLRDAAEGEHGNAKAEEGKNRVFVLAANNCVEENGGELFLWFEYRPVTMNDWAKGEKQGKTPPKQSALISMAIARLCHMEESFLDKWLHYLMKKVNAQEKPSETSVLERHLNRYTQKNKFDYFIHKLHFLIFLASNPHGIEAFQDGFDFFVV